MWSGIEASASVVCANLPCYAPLLRSPPSSRKNSSATSLFRSAYTPRSASAFTPRSVSTSNPRITRCSTPWPSARPVSTPFALQRDRIPLDPYPDAPVSPKTIPPRGGRGCLDAPVSPKTIPRSLERGEQGLGLPKADDSFWETANHYRGGREAV